MATVTVPDGAPAFVAHRYETASSYDVLVPTPGTYELVKDGSKYWATVPCRRVETYRESRLLTAASSELRLDVDEPDTYRLSVFAFQVGRRTTLDSGWSITPTPKLVAA